jgi:hypothetical protein
MVSKRELRDEIRRLKSELEFFKASFYQHKEDQRIVYNSLKTSMSRQEEAASFFSLLLKHVCDKEYKIIRSSCIYGDAPICSEEELEPQRRKLTQEGFKYACRYGDRAELWVKEKQCL